MKLYMDPVATTCRPIMMFIADHGIAVETIPLCLAKGDHSAAWFLDINPHGLVPVLEDGDFRLTESATILRYLASIAASPTYPQDIRARARVDETLDWLNTSLLRDLAFGFVYPQLLRDQHGFPQDPAQAAFVSRGQKRAERLFTALDRKLARHDGPYLLGPHLSLADYFGACVATVAELIDFDLSAFPGVVTWLATMKAQPNWAICNGAFEGWARAVRTPA